MMLPMMVFWDYMTALYGDNQKFHLHRLELNSGAGTPLGRSHYLWLGGSIMHFLIADDEWLDTKLARQMDVVRDVNADIVHCSYNIKNSSGELVGVALAKKQLVIYDFFLEKSDRYELFFGVGEAGWSSRNARDKNSPGLCLLVAVSFAKPAGNCGVSLNH